MGFYLIFPQAEASKLTWRFRLKASPSYRWMIAPRTENYWLLCCSITMKFATLSLLFSFFLYVSLCTQFPSLVFEWTTWALWNDSMNVWFEDWSSDIPGYLAKNHGVAEAIARGMWFKKIVPLKVSFLGFRKMSDLIQLRPTKIRPINCTVDLRSNSRDSMVE